jgi:long-chain acyl-CoA synthetase
MSIATLNDIFFAAVERNLDRIMLYREAGKWLPVTSREFGQKTARTARALHASGIQPGDRIAVLAENRPEWPMADLASLLLGAVTVPLYTTLTAQQTAFVLKDSGCRAIFVSSDHQLHKILSVLPQTQIEKIIVMDPVEFIGDLAPFAGKCASMSQITSEGPDDLGAEIETQARAIGPDDLATIVYTSGTTGTSKGAMLTHGNIASNISCSLLGFDLQPGADQHFVFAALPHHRAPRGFFHDLPRRHPGLLPVHGACPRRCWKCGRPRLSPCRAFTKRFTRRLGARPADLPRRALSSIGHFPWDAENKPEILGGRTPTSRSWRLANKLVFSKIREGMGGRVGPSFPAARPSGRELAEWYADAGIRIHEGYGLDRNFAGDRGEYAGQSPHRNGGQDSSESRSAHR